MTGLTTAVPPSQQAGTRDPCGALGGNGMGLNLLPAARDSVLSCAFLEHCAITEGLWRLPRRGLEEPASSTSPIPAPQCSSKTGTRRQDRGQHEHPPAGA